MSDELRKIDEWDYENTMFIVCPYCGHEHTDSWLEDPREDFRHEWECEECEKEFTVSVHLEMTYSSHKEAPDA